MLIFLTLANVKASRSRPASFLAWAGVSLRSGARRFLMSSAVNSAAGWSHAVHVAKWAEARFSLARRLVSVHRLLRLTSAT